MDPSPSTTASYFADFGLISLALALVLLNGFFVAAEFAMVKLRATRVAEIADQHGWRGKILRTVHDHLDAYLSACQLGITLASLGLGWVGEPAFAHLLTPLVHALGVQSEAAIHGMSFFAAFFVISFLHIVLGELAPKSWAIRQPEKLSLWTAIPLYLFYWLMFPAIYLLNASANAILRIAGQGGPSKGNDNPYSREELKLILHSSRSLNPTDRGMQVLASAVEMGELEVADWANSREDLIQLDVNASLPDILETVRLHKYSRYPVYDGTKDEYVGLLHIKDLLLALAVDDEHVQLHDLLRPLDCVSKHMPLPKLLEKFRQGGSHIALVEEGDGKVIGYLTMEDVLEVLVGDIQDEHRKAERGLLAYQPGKLLVRGDTPLFKIERELDMDLSVPNIQADTLAGLVYESLKRMPEEDETFEIAGLRITIKKMRGPRIVLAKVLKQDS